MNNLTPTRRSPQAYNNNLKLKIKVYNSLKHNQIKINMHKAFKIIDFYQKKQKIVYITIIIIRNKYMNKLWELKKNVLKILIGIL